MDSVLAALTQNIQRIFVATLVRSFDEAGVLKSEKVVRLRTGRLVTEEECCLVHSNVFWQSWIDSDNITEEERDKLAKGILKKRIEKYTRDVLFEYHRAVVPVFEQLDQ